MNNGYFLRHYVLPENYSGKSKTFKIRKEVVLLQFILLLCPKKILWHPKTCTVEVALQCFATLFKEYVMYAHGLCLLKCSAFRNIPSRFLPVLYVSYKVSGHKIL